MIVFLEHHTKEVTCLSILENELRYQLSYETQSNTTYH